MSNYIDPTKVPVNLWNAEAKFWSHLRVAGLNCWLRSRSADDALDLSQRAFLQAFEAARRALPRLLASSLEVPFKAWLLRIAVQIHVADWLNGQQTESYALVLSTVVDLN